MTNPESKDPGDPNFTVLMNYEFIDDFAISTRRYVCENKKGWECSAASDIIIPPKNVPNIFWFCASKIM